MSPRHPRPQPAMGSRARAPGLQRPWRQRAWAAARRQRAGGYTLLEVAVAMFVVAFGLLGLAKMQVQAVSSTQMSRARALAALRASSLAGAMQANRAYWGLLTPTGFALDGATVVSPPDLAATQADCDGTAPAAAPRCTPTQMAAHDVQSWARNVARALPDFTGSAVCSPAGPTSPASCALRMNWRERNVATQEGAQADSAGTGGQRSLIVYIQP